MQRRSAKRTNVNKDCQFSAVQDDNNTYTVLEKKYTGILLDISVSGGKVICKMPIKEGQLIHVDFKLTDDITHEAIGKIISTKKSTEGNDFVLHIKFIEISLNAKNDINAYIYGYKN